MSETATPAATLLDASGEVIGATPHPDAHILDSQGRALSQSRRQPVNPGDALRDAVRQQPVVAVLVGVAFGLLIGRLTA